MFTALLDANTLVPVSLADTILRAAERDLFQPLWSQDILDETVRALCRVHPNTSAVRFQARVRQMTKTFPDALVDGYELLATSISLPDPGDRHVIAAARVGGADVIVTCNLKDFPEDVLSDFNLEAVDPDCFLRDMFDLFPSQMVAVLKEQADDLKKPAKDLDDVLISLGRAGAQGFVRDVRTYLSEVHQ